MWRTHPALCDAPHRQGWAWPDLHCQGRALGWSTMAWSSSAEWTCEVVVANREGVQQAQRCLQGAGVLPRWVQQHEGPVWEVGIYGWAWSIGKRVKEPSEEAQFFRKWNNIPASTEVYNILIVTTFQHYNLSTVTLPIKQFETRIVLSTLTI
jgi:hypothetical protein